MDFARDGRRLAVVEVHGNIGRIVIVNAQSGDRKRLPARVIGDVLGCRVVPRRAPDRVRQPRVKSDVHDRPDGTGKRLAFTARVSGIDTLAWQPRP